MTNGNRVLIDKGALQATINMLRRDADEGRSVRGEMADELERSVCADGGKGEAVRFQSPLDGRWITVPQAECAPREKQNVMNIPLDAAATMADYVPQAECAPREAYQSALDILANVRAHGGDFDSAIALLKLKRNPKSIIDVGRQILLYGLR